jgi:uncharacterized protein
MRKILSSAVLLCISVLQSSVLFSQYENHAIKPYIINVVKDKYVPAAFQNQQIGGILGERMKINLIKRLLQVNQDAMISGFVSRPGKQDWVGEHIGKYLETSCNVWQFTRNQALKIQMDSMVHLLISTQLPDGYLGTYTPDKYWTSWDVWVHKYDMIGLLAYYKTFSYIPALEAAKKIGNLLIKTFGTGYGQKDLITAGEHVGMAATSVLDPIVDLYSYTGDERYLAFAKYIIGTYNQPNGPKIIQGLLNKETVNKIANGKAYEMLSNLVGIIKLYKVTGEKDLFLAVENAWNDIVVNRLYITGTASAFERFQGNHFLPAGKREDMGEGCVTTTWIQLNFQLLSITGDAKYMDQIEKSVYNHLLAAENPQSGCVSYYTSLMDKKPFSCDITCCLSSVPRGISMIPQFNYGQILGVPTFLLYETSTIKDSVSITDNATGQKIALSINSISRFPSEGHVTYTISPAKKALFSISFRVPAWASHFEATVNGKIYPGESDQFLSIKRVWQPGDRIIIDFKIPVEIIDGGPSYKNFVAFRRGPQVLCEEGSLNKTLTDSLDPAVLVPGKIILRDRSSILPSIWIGHQVYELTASNSSTQKKNVLLVPFADAGQTGKDLKVWLPVKVTVPYFGRFKELPITAIRPRGWIREYLIKQRNGLTGHLDDMGYPFNSNAWAKEKLDTIRPNAELWYPFEQNAYWVDGMIRCGYLLQDSFLINKAMMRIRYVLDHAAADGYLGPEFMRNSKQGDRWTHAVFFRALQAYFSASKDQHIPEALSRHYLNEDFPFTGIRESVNLEAMAWAYGATGDTALLHFAEKVYRNSDKANKGSSTTPESFISDAPSYEHGVTYNERAKLGAILFLYTGDESYLQPSIAAYQKIDKYHMMVDGVNISSEQLRKMSSMELHETCDIADFTWSNGYLLMATGNASYADKIERACFNAAPAAVTEDFKALQYFSGPNQTVVTHSSSHSVYEGGGKSMQYGPMTFTECCPANVNRIMPNFAARMWLTDNSGGLVAAMYGPSEVTYNVGDKKKLVRIEENTQYPFEGRIELLIHLTTSTFFPLTLRIPGWCKEAKIFLNNKRLLVKNTPGSFLKIERTFRNLDKIRIEFEQEIKTTTWPDNGIAIERGPLVYSLKIEEDWKIDHKDTTSTKDFPAYDLNPASPWNYALGLDTADLKKSILVHQLLYSDDPWSLRTAPLELKVLAKRVNGWELLNSDSIKTEKWYSIQDDKGTLEWKFDPKFPVKGNIIQTPGLPSASMIKNSANEKWQEVTLIPYGCTKLRVTIFPFINAESK